MYFENFNYGDNIKFKYIDFPFDINTELSKQVSMLKEDLIQIHYTNGYILDVGYYPEFDFKRGLFKIVVSKNEHDNTIISYSAKDIDSLIKNISLAIGVIQDTFKDIYTYKFFRQNCARCQWGLIKIKCERSKDGFELINSSNLNDRVFERLYQQLSTNKDIDDIDLSNIKITILYAQYEVIWGSNIKEIPLYISFYYALRQYLDK